MCPVRTHALGTPLPLCFSQVFILKGLARLYFVSAHSADVTGDAAHSGSLGIGRNAFITYMTSLTQESGGLPRLPWKIGVNGMNKTAALPKGTASFRMKDLDFLGFGSRGVFLNGHSISQFDL